MNIKIISVGKLKEKYLVQGINEYVKRLGAYAKIELIEVADEKAPENLSPAEIIQIKDKEADRILAKIKEQEYVFALAIDGVNPSSEQLAQQINQLGIQGKSQLVFVIGGSLGLSDRVLQRSQSQISFGKMTYPHQLMRLILVEQIYRSFRINRGEPYHKWGHFFEENGGMTAFLSELQKWLEKENRTENAESPYWRDFRVFCLPTNLRN